MTTTFDAELDAVKTIYAALVGFPMQDRDRLLRMVQERLARERTPTRPPPRVAVVEEIAPGLHRTRHELV